MPGVNWSESDLSRWAATVSECGRPLPAVAKKIKVPRPSQNKWEAEYDAELRVKRGAGVIQWYGFEAIKLRLAGGTYYTPDFAVMDSGRLEFHEVKGFWREDALVKFKVAAEYFPFLFCAWRKRKVSEGGGWELIKAVSGAAK